MSRDKPNLDEAAKALHMAGIPPKLTPGQSKLLIGVLQLVAKGEPVSPDWVKEVASKTQLPSGEAVSFIKQASEVDGEGNIIGIYGLSQKDHPHRFRVEDRMLSTWCAWDALFLPVLIKQTATVESICPVTNVKIKLTLSPEKVLEYVPESAVLSIVLPKPSEEGLRSAGKIGMIFCHYVLFFSSSEAAAKWFEGKDCDLVICSIEEGYQLGRKAFTEIIKYV